MADPLFLMNATTPQGKAYDWLLNHDPHCPDPRDCGTIQQRYALAVLYFATNGANWAYIEDTLNVAGDVWLSASHECDWYGVTCSWDSDCNDAVKVVKIWVGK